MPEADTTTATNEPRASTRRVAQLALRGTVWSVAGNYGEQLIGFVSTLIFTNILNVDIFGTMVLAMSWVGYLNVRPKLGLTYAATSQPVTTPQLLGTYLVLDILAGVLSLLIVGIAGIVLIERGIINSAVAQIMQALLLAEVIASIAAPYAIALEREMQLSRVSLNKLVVAVLSHGLGLLLAFSGFGIVSQVVLNIAAFLFWAVGIVLVCRKRLPGVFAMRWRFDLPLAKTLLRAGVTSGLALAVTHFVSTFDYVLIGAYVSTEATTFYERAFRIASWPQVLFTLVVARVGYLTFVRVRGDLPRLTHAVRLCMWALLVLGMPLVLTLVFAAPNIVRAFYGERYFESVRYLRFLSVITFSWSLINVGFWLAVAMGEPRRSLMISLAQAGVLLVAGLVLTQLYGVMGTLAAVALAMLVGCVLSLMYTHRTVKLGLVDTYAKPIFAALCCIGALWALTRLPLFESYDVAAAPAFLSARVFWFGRASLIGITAYAVFFGALVALQPDEMRERLTYLRVVWRSAA